jgi:hypothetical protein
MNNDGPSVASRRKRRKADVAEKNGFLIRTRMAGRTVVQYGAK